MVVALKLENKNPNDNFFLNDKSITETDKFSPDGEHFIQLLMLLFTNNSAPIAFQYEKSIAPLSSSLRGVFVDAFTWFGAAEEKFMRLVTDKIRRLQHLPLVNVPIPQLGTGVTALLLSVNE